MSTKKQQMALTNGVPRKLDRNFVNYILNNLKF